MEHIDASMRENSLWVSAKRPSLQEFLHSIIVNLLQQHVQKPDGGVRGEEAAGVNREMMGHRRVVSALGANAYHSSRKTKRRGGNLSIAQRLDRRRRLPPLGVPSRDPPIRGRRHRRSGEWLKPMVGDPTPSNGWHL